MAEVTLTIGDRNHTIACADGQEGQVRRLGNMLQDRWDAARRASGGFHPERTMLFVALMLADTLDEAGRSPAPAPVRPGESLLLAQVADRLEALAAALEEDAASA